MKKILLIFCILSISLLSFAADLNPFAYGLKSEFNPSTLTLTVNFSLNAPAEYMKLAISDGTTDVWTKEYFGKDYISGKVPKTDYKEVIDVSELSKGTDHTWRVEVKGAEVSTPTFVKNDVRLYAPTSVDIDNNPENPNFGTVFCVDGLNNAYQTSGYTSYLSYTDGAGLYVLNADGTARKMPFQGEKVRYGYNGSVVSNGDRPFFGNNGTNNLRGYNAFRVRVSDDGRIFVTSFSTNGHILWEAKKECFSATTQEEWSANTGWYKIMTTADSNTKMATTKRNCSHDDCGIYSLYQGNADTGPFIAGPNLGFDVRGSGDNLKLLMLAGCKQAIVWSTPGHYYCDEYDLGRATLWNTPPSRRIFAGHSNGVDIVNPQGVQVQYDKNGNVWMCQHRGVKTNTTLARVNRSLASTKKNNVEIGQVDHNESSHTYRRCGAIRFNEDFSQVAIASNANGAGGGFTVYPVDASTGMPLWEQGTEVNTYSKTGNSLMDFAWDYAGNLYIAADAATNGERIAVYAMPHSADRVVSTPAASKYTFSVDCEPGATYTVTTICDPEEGGTITCSLGSGARAAGVLNDIPSCSELTVTATPEHGYQFLCWEDDEKNVVSTNTEYTFYVTRNITLTAKFEYATYSGLVWKNLFKNGEDIADIESADFTERNERLWRLFQVEYNNFSSMVKNKGTQVDAGSKTVNSMNLFHVWNFFMLGNNTLYYSDKSKAPGSHGEIFTTILEPFMRNTEGTPSSSRWLGTFLEKLANKEINNTNTSTGNFWAFFLQSFINRTSGFYDGSLNSCTLNNYTCPDFTIYGQPKYWRPYWAEHACGLKATMTYDEYMPTADTWIRPDCPSGSIKKNGTSTYIYPSDWYKWNENPDADTYLLAWRANSATGDTIVHHVYRSNLELHASYVKKNIDEEDNVDVNSNDASNDDVIKLMQNRNFVGLNPDTTVQPTHTLTVTRKLRAGMYNTICLPFGVDLTGLQEGHDLKNAEAWEFAGTTSDTYNESGDPVTVLNFNKVTTLEAGKPYFIKLKGNKDVTTDMTFSGVSSKPYVYPQSGGGLIFHPTINPTTIPAGALILVANDRLAVNTEDGQMLGLRGYFQIDETDPIFASEIKQRAAEGRVYLSFKKPVTTSVPLAPEAEQPRKPQVSKIMRDGKIYIIRDGVTYTITGARVR